METHTNPLRTADTYRGWIAAMLPMVDDPQLLRTVYSLMQVHLQHKKRPAEGGGLSRRDPEDLQ